MRQDQCFALFIDPGAMSLNFRPILKDQDHIFVVPKS